MCFVCHIPTCCLNPIRVTFSPIISHDFVLTHVKLTFSMRKSYTKSLLASFAWSILCMSCWWKKPIVSFHIFGTSQWFQWHFFIRTFASPLEKAPGTESFWLCGWAKKKGIRWSEIHLKNWDILMGYLMIFMGYPLVN